MDEKSKTKSAKNGRARDEVLEQGEVEATVEKEKSVRLMVQRFCERHPIQRSRLENESAGNRLSNVPCCQVTQLCCSASQLRF
jgi:hypothetical protein